MTDNVPVGQVELMEKSDYDFRRGYFSPKIEFRIKVMMYHFLEKRICVPGVKDLCLQANYQ